MGPTCITCLPAGVVLVAHLVERSLSKAQLFNPRHACAARVTVVVSLVCLSVCVSVCLSVCLLPRFLLPRTRNRPKSDMNATLA